MVKIPFILIFILWTLSVPLWAAQVELRMEFSKDDIYEGEHTLCNFVLYAQSSGVEVEVAKFPEFRGFWSENLALRQGPLPLSPEFERPGWYKTIIGSYLLTSMVGQEKPAIVPMKLVIKSTNRFNPTGEKERTIQSAGPPPRIEKLPPVTDPIFEKDKFRGAVGSFVLTTQDETLLFQKSEPILLRVLLQGEGNFREINELPLTLPEGVEILSQNAYAKGSGQYYTKAFEFTLAVHRDEDLVLPPVTLLYFHPRLGSYQQLRTVPIQLRFEPTPPPALGDLQTPAESLFPRWSAHQPLWHSPWFWLMHLVLGIVWGGNWVRRQGRALRQRWRGRPRPANYRHQLKALSDDLEAGRLQEFMKASKTLADTVLRSKLKRPVQTPGEALRQAPIPDPTRQSLIRLFEDHDRFLYSRHKTPPSDPKGHLHSVQQLIASK